MWEVLKTICGLILIAGIVLGVLMTGFIFSWVFKIIGFILAVVVTLVLLGWIVWELVSGWRLDRKQQKKAPK